jgi:hypothetical protein
MSNMATLFRVWRERDAYGVEIVDYQSLRSYDDEPVKEAAADSSGRNIVRGIS